jgi:hypothetical protein
MGGVESACGVRWDVLRVPRCLAAAFGGGGGVGTTPKGNAKSKSEPRPLAHVPSHPRPSFLAARLLRVDEPGEGGRSCCSVSFARKERGVDDAERG